MTNCGIDIIEISRIEYALKKSPSFLERVFSEEEISYYHKNGKRAESLAGFFAAKEAFSKYLGTGISGFSFSDISVCHNEKGKPFIKFKDEIPNVSLSISHNKTSAIAMVVGSSHLASSIETLNGFDISPSTKKEMKSLIPPRFEDSSKGDYGKILVIAGSKGMSGAAALSSYSALKSGSGLVTLLTAESERAIAAGFFPEIMTKGIACDQNGIISLDAKKEILPLLKGKDAIVFGPGLGRAPQIFDILENILKEATGTLLIDADGLNALSENPEILKESSLDIILTPHPKEMSRLTKKSVSCIQENRLWVSKQFAKEYGVTLVLKGSKTIVASKDGEHFINPTGNPGLSTAGTGDVLSGMIASFKGQGLSPFDASRLGVFLHGLSADIYKNRLGCHGLVASDVINSIPAAINALQNF